MTLSSSISGKLLSSRAIPVDASAPSGAVAHCARLCTDGTGCTGFDISLVHNKCNLYSDIKQRTSLAGYIAGLKKGR